MEKEVKIKIAFAMIIGGIIGFIVGVILLSISISISSSNDDIVFNDFKEKTRKFKENNEYVFLDNVSETNRDEILEYAKLNGYQLYNFINNNNNFNTDTYNIMIFKKNNIEN